MLFRDKITETFFDFDEYLKEKHPTTFKHTPRVACYKKHLGLIELSNNVLKKAGIEIILG